MSAREVMAGVTVDPEVRFGEPCIAGTGITCWAIADRFKGGDTFAELAQDYFAFAPERFLKIEAALRWELLSPSVRKRRIAKALAGEAQ